MRDGMNRSDPHLLYIITEKRPTMRKLELNHLKLQSFITGMEDRTAETAKGGRKTDLNDTNCSAIDLCVTARGCTDINCN